MDSCCICLSPLHDDIQICVCSCNHYIHVTCYRLVVDSGLTSCPICRNQLLHQHADQSYESNSEDDDVEDESEIDEGVDGETQDDHDNRMLDYWIPVCDRLLVKHAYLALFDPLLPHNTTRSLHFRYLQVLAFYYYLCSCILYSEVNGDTIHAQKISQLDSNRFELDMDNYNEANGFEWDGKDLNELYSGQGGTYSRGDEAEDDEAEDDEEGETKVEDDKDEEL
jgi:hypothetical protein